MKNSILIITLALFTFSCSTEDVAIPDDQNSQLQRDTQLSESINALLSSEDFRSFITSRQNQRNSGSNGPIILNDGYNFFYLAFVENNAYLIGGSGSIQAMPNGRAKFAIHTNNPSAAVINFDDFTTTYSSDCIDGPLGAFNYSYISEYIVDVFEPVPGLIFTSYIPTGENASREVANGHCNMSDAQPIFDDNFEFVGCGEATEFKTMRIRPNGNNFPIISVN